MRFHFRRAVISVGTAFYALLAFYLTIFECGLFTTDKEYVSHYNNYGTVRVPCEVDRAPVDYLLHPDYAPNTVFYVWCKRSCLEFQHYLNIRSVINNLRPDNVVFFYAYEPPIDSVSYNTFYWELKEEYAFFRTIQVNESSNICQQFGRANLDFIRQLLSKWGGWYIHESTLVSNYTASFRNVTFINGINEDTGRGFMLSQLGFPVDNMTNPNRITTMKCAPNITQYNAAAKDNKPFCIDVNFPYVPKNIWGMEDDFGRLCRRIFYGSSDIPVARQDFSVLAPNIGHMIWMGGGRMDFLFFLGVLSLLYVAEVEMVYMHGDGPPIGPYWNKLKKHPRVRYIFRKIPKTVYGNSVLDRPHVSDVLRVDIMVRYGGIYIDSDSVVVRKFDEGIRAYDAVVSYDWTQWDLPFEVGITPAP